MLAGCTEEALVELLEGDLYRRLPTRELQALVCRTPELEPRVGREVTHRSVAS
jgi:hypothetical protein